MTKRKIHKKSYYLIISSIKKIFYFHLGLGNIHHLTSQFPSHSHSCGLWYTVVGTQAITPFNISVLQFFYQTWTQFFFKCMNGMKDLFCLIPAVIQQDNVEYDTITQLLDIYHDTIPGSAEELLAQFKRWESM